MSKQIEINLFEKNKNQIFNYINETILMMYTNFHLNSKFIKDYINEPPKLNDILNPDVVAYKFAEGDNINNYRTNYEIINDLSPLLQLNKILDKNNSDFYNTLHQNMGVIINNTRKKNIFLMDNNRPSNMTNKTTLTDFYKLVQDINKKLAEIKKKYRDLPDEEQQFYEYFNSKIKNNKQNIHSPLEIFQNDEIIEDLFINLSNNKSTSYLSEQNDIIKDYWKYCFPDKKFDLSTIITDKEKNTVITFYNIYFVLKNFYLLDKSTIQCSIPDNGNKADFIITNLKLFDINSTKYDINFSKFFKIDQPSSSFKVIFECQLDRFYAIPKLKINFGFKDKEDPNTKPITFKKQLLPKMIDASFNNYNDFYIDLSNSINYKNPKKSYKIILNEINKTSKNNLLTQKDFFLDQELTDKFINSNNTASDIFDNIHFLLIDQLKLIDKKISYNNNYYLIDDIFIMKKSNECINIINKKPITDTSFNIDLSFSDYLHKKPDMIHCIYLILYVYKLKTKDEKVGLKRQIITEGCLNRASILDEFFKDSLYKFLDMTDTKYLTNRLKKKGGKKTQRKHNKKTTKKYKKHKKIKSIKSKR